MSLTRLWTRTTLRSRTSWKAPKDSQDLGNFVFDFAMRIEDSQKYSRMTPADEERERAYSLAENLNFQLDDMSSQLSTLISEMNALSTKTETEDDPLTMITRILGEHLSSLEWVNGSVEDLETKLQDLNRVSGIAHTEAERLHRGVLESKSLFSSS
jgi:hypothetical protein